MRTSIFLSANIGGLSQCLQRCLYVAVELLHGSDVHALVRAVRMLDSRTERDHLHALVFGTDDTALQTGNLEPMIPHSKPA